MKTIKKLQITLLITALGIHKLPAPVAEGRLTVENLREHNNNNQSIANVRKLDLQSIAKKTTDILAKEAKIIHDQRNDDRLSVSSSTSSSSDLSIESHFDPQQSVAAKMNLQQSLESLDVSDMPTTPPPAVPKQSSTNPFDEPDSPGLILHDESNIPQPPSYRPTPPPSQVATTDAIKKSIAQTRRITSSKDSTIDTAKKSESKSTNPFDDSTTDISSQQPLQHQNIQEILQKSSPQQQALYLKEDLSNNPKIYRDDSGNLIFESNLNGKVITKSIDKNGKTTTTTVDGSTTTKTLPDKTTITTTTQSDGTSKSVIQKGVTNFFKGQVTKTITQKQFILTIEKTTEGGTFSKESTKIQKIDFSNFMDQLTKVNTRDEAGKKQAGDLEKSRLHRF